MPKFIEEDEIKINAKATKEFTDREEPRKAFWEKYNKMLQGNSNEIQVISYYGFGGIGKSSLLLKLKEEIEEKVPNSKIEFLDIEKLEETNNNLLDILKVIEKDLRTRYNFSFPIFDLVAYEYETKMGRTATKPELSSIFDESKELGFLKDVISEIPLIGSFAKIIYFADAGKNLLKDRLQNNKLRQRLLDIENTSAEEIKQHLSYYFALDLKENLKNEKAPFVFFIDTYEKLVNELTQRGDVLSNDLWLRSDEGLICRVPNVLWVIAGREKLKWQEIDESWNDALDQHLLGVLSLSDATHFLQTAGIEDEQLIHQIYNLTHGTPMYLDLCVDTYLKLKEKGQEPTIDDFNGDTTKLIKRFLMYMDDTERDFTIMLAHIPEWTDDTIEAISMKMNGSFSFSLYEKVKSFSFVENENGKYRIHESIKDIVVANTPEIMRNKYSKVQEEETNEKIEKIIQNEEVKIKEIEQKEQKPISYINTYTSRTSYKKIIDNLINNICSVKSMEAFKEKANYLISKIEDYENRYDIPVKLNSTNTRLFKEIKQYADSKEYAKLKCFEDLDLTEALKSVEQLEKHGIDNTYYVKRYIRHTDKIIKDNTQFDELYNLLSENKDLYFIKLLSLINENHPKYNEYKDECEFLLDKYSGKINTFYIEILLSFLQTSRKSISNKTNEEEKGTYSSIDSIMERFNQLLGEVNSVTSEIEEDAGIDIDKKNFNAEKIELLVKCFENNPKLLTSKILNNILSLAGDGFSDETKKLLFEYLYSIRYIALNSSDIDIINSFYNLFKEYLGGEYNISYFNTEDEEIAIKSMYALEELKDKYIELYGADSFIVNEAETFILKYKIKNQPKFFDEIIDENIKKFGITNDKTANTLLILVKEINNYINKKSASLTKNEKEWFNSLIKYGNQLLDGLTMEDFADGKINIYTHVINTIYKTLKLIYDLEENEQQRTKYLSEMYGYCYKIMKFYNDQTEIAKELSCLFDITENCLDEYFKDNSKTYYLNEVEKVANLILENNWNNECLERLMVKYSMFELYKDISKIAEEYKENVDSKFLEAYNKRDIQYLNDMINRNLCYMENYKKLEWYNVLIAHVWIECLLPRLDVIINDYHKLVDIQEKGEEGTFSKDNPIHILLALGDVLKSLTFKQWRLNNVYRYDLYGYYLNIVYTIEGEICFDMNKMTEKNRKRFHFREYDKDKLYRLDKLNNLLKHIRYNVNSKKDCRYENVYEIYNK